MIPKIIHYCWFGTAKLGEYELKCIESWKKFCPDYIIKKWDENSIDISKFDYMREAYEAKAWGFVPDIARLIIIYNEGGIYLDTDVEIIRPLDGLLDNNAFLGFEDNKHVNLGQGFGAEPKNPIIGKMLSDYSTKHFILGNGVLDKTPSPVIQSRSLYEMGMKAKNSYQKLDHVTIYPKEYFCPISFDTGEYNITEKTYSIHHFKGSWLDQYQIKMLEKERSILNKYGNRIGKIVWLVYRIFNRIKKDGIIKPISLYIRRKTNG